MSAPACPTTTPSSAPPWPRWCAAIPESVAVVGAGITGLATAWFLRDHADVTVYEAGDRVGGKIETASLLGVPVEAGPDTFLARVPWAVDLCQALGLEDDLIPPATGKAYVWTRGRLRPLPEDTVLGVPYRLGPLARSGIVSPWGLARAGLDLVLPRTKGDGDRSARDGSVREIVGRRFGPEVVARLVEPLLGGIHAGRADRLSLASVAPQVADAAAQRSLLLALRRAPRAGAGPVFLGLRGGLQRLVDRLAEGLDIRLRTPVQSWADLQADHVVLTVPAYRAADLAPREAAVELEAIDYASVVTVTLAYPPEALAQPLDGSGFLVPRVDGRLITACTWTSSKWPHPETGDVVLLRASAGRIGDDRALRLDDESLVARVHEELTEAMGLRSAPTASLVTRWPRSFPQYDVGHGARVARIERLLPPHVQVAGAAYRGVGIAACIRQAELAAQRIIRSGP